MDPFITLKSLATETWFVELLAGKGFSKSSENTFTNGKAKIRVEGTRFFADPGAEDSTFKADFRQADRKTVIFMVDQILKMHAFRTDEELMQERAEKKNVDRALAGIAHTIREGPDTGGGVQLRRFLWSLYNMHHVVNLWRLMAELDNERAGWVTEVFAGALAGLVKESDLKCALQNAGEIERWDKMRSSNETMERFDQAQHPIEELVKTIPPCRAHTELVRLLQDFAQVRAAINESTDKSP